MRSFLIMLLTTLWLPPGLYAQLPCLDTDRLSTCMGKVANLPADDNRKQSVNQENQRRLTPADSQSGTTSSLKDFLPPLAVVVQSVALDQKNQQVVVDLNAPSSFADHGLATQLQLIIRQPKLFDPVQRQATAAQAQKLTSELNDLNDVTALATFGLQNRSFGRRLSTNNDIFVGIFKAIKSQSGMPDLEAKANQLKLDCSTKAPGDPLMSELSDDAKNTCLDAAARRGELQRLRQEALTHVQIKRLADLLNNQPQFLLTASYRAKNELVGPDEESAQLSLEWSHKSLNGFRRELERTKPQDEALLSAFETFSQGADHEGRCKVLVQYTRLERYSLLRPDEVLTLKQPAATRWTGSFTYGKPLLFDSKGQEAGRIDAALQYENFSDDPQHKDRGVASFTYTQKLSDTFSFPVGLVYANHERFLSDVQTRFSAHFGLKMKLFGNS